MSRRRATLTLSYAAPYIALWLRGGRDLGPCLGRRHGAHKQPPHQIAGQTGPKRARREHAGYRNTRQKGLWHTERPQGQGDAPVGRQDQRAGAGVRGADRRRPSRNAPKRWPSAPWRARASTTLLPEAFANCREAATPRAGPAGLRRAADGRHLPASGQHRRDEDRRGQDPCRHLPGLSERADRQGRAYRHRQRLPGQARRRMDGQGLCARWA